MRSGTVENLHDFKGKLDKIKELKILKKIYAVTLDKCAKVRYHIIKWIYCRYYGILIKIDSKMLDVFKNDLVNAKCL